MIDHQKNNNFIPFQAFFGIPEKREKALYYKAKMAIV